MLEWIIQHLYLRKIRLNAHILWPAFKHTTPEQSTTTTATTTTTTTNQQQQQTTTNNNNKQQQQTTTNNNKQQQQQQKQQQLSNHSQKHRPLSLWGTRLNKAVSTSFFYSNTVPFENNNNENMENKKNSLF